MNKKILNLFLLLFVIVSLCGCGNADSSNTDSGIIHNNGDNDSRSNDIISDIINMWTEEVKEQSYFEKLFRNGSIPVRDESSLWGYIDSSGDYVIPPVFTVARSFEDNGLALVQDAESQLWGMIDTSGNYVVEPSFTHIGNSFQEGFLGVRVPDKGWGYINEAGEIVIEPQFRVAEGFRNGFARVSSQLASDGRGTYYLWGYINISGERITEDIFFEAYDFSEGLALVKNENYLIPYGYIDGTGEYAIKPSYYNATSFSDGVAFVDFGDTDYSLIDKEGNVLYSKIWSNPSTSSGYKVYFNQGLCPIQTTDGSGYVYINTKGEVVLPKDGQPFERARSFTLTDEFAAVVDKESGLCGYIDLNGDWVIPPQYEYFSAGDFHSGIALVTLGTADDISAGNGKTELIDTSGNCILEFSKDVGLQWSWSSPERIAVAEYASGKFGFWNLEGDVVIDYIFDEVKSFASDYSYAKVKYEGLWGIIDKDGNWLIPAKFQEM